MALPALLPRHRNEPPAEPDQLVVAGEVGRPLPAAVVPSVASRFHADEVIGIRKVDIPLVPVRKHDLELALRHGESVLDENSADISFESIGRADIALVLGQHGAKATRTLASSPLTCLLLTTYDRQRSSPGAETLVEDVGQVAERADAGTVDDGAGHCRDHDASDLGSISGRENASTDHVDAGDGDSSRRRDGDADRRLLTGVVSIVGLEQSMDHRCRPTIDHGARTAREYGGAATEQEVRLLSGEPEDATMYGDDHLPGQEAIYLVAGDTLPPCRLPREDAAAVEGKFVQSSDRIHGVMLVAGCDSFLWLPVLTPT